MSEASSDEGGNHEPLFHIVLYEPEIPPNTGNVIRLAANTGAHLHLVEPLGFELSDTKLRRAGLDYRDLARVTVHPSIESLWATVPSERTYAFSTKGTNSYTNPSYKVGDAFMFGPETRGLPASIRTRYQGRLLRIPMQPESRSLNLANAVAVVLFEAWRQLDFRAKP